MKNFRQFNEDASGKLSDMDDSQIADLKKNNPGAAAKIDAIRKNRAKKTSSAPAPSSAPKLKTSAIVKPSAIVKSDKTPSGADTARMKARQSQMGKFAQGIKNSPGALAKKAGSGLAKTPGSGLTKRDDIKNVDVKDVTPKKVEDEKQAIGNRTQPKPVSDMADKQRARINQNSALIKGKKKDNKNRIGSAIKGIGRAAAKALKTKTDNSIGSEKGDSLEALQRNSY